MFYTYIVASRRNGTLYTGHTDDIVRRAEEHRLEMFPGFAQDITASISFGTKITPPARPPLRANAASRSGSESGNSI